MGAIEDVIKSEGTEPESIKRVPWRRKNGKTEYTGKVSATYETKIDMNDVIITYTFESNQLISVTITFLWDDIPNLRKTIKTRISRLSSGLFFLKDKKGFLFSDIWYVGNQKLEFENGFFSDYYLNVDSLNKFTKTVLLKENADQVFTEASNDKTNFSLTLSTENWQFNVSDEFIGYFKYTPKDFISNKYL